MSMVSEHKGEFVAKEWPVVVGKADSAVELRIAGHALLNAWHADQDKADVVAVEKVAPVFQSCGIEAFSFIKDDQFHVFPRQGARRLARVLVDADIDVAEQFIDLMSKRTEKYPTSAREWSSRTVVNHGLTGLQLASRMSTSS